jgi:hypothetical protein
VNSDTTTAARIIVSKMRSVVVMRSSI